MSVPFATSRPELTSQKEGGEETGDADAISGLSLFGPSNGRPQRHRWGRIIYALLIFTLIEPGRPTHPLHQSPPKYKQFHSHARIGQALECCRSWEKGKTGVRFPYLLPPHSNGLDWLEEIIPFRAIWNMCVFASVFKIYIDLITSKEATLTVLVETGSKLQSLP